MRPMHMRRSLALVSGALLLTAPLVACGSSDPTEQVNNIATGATDRDAAVDVLNAVVVSAEEGSGTFVATFVNNDTSEAATVETLESASPEAAQVSEFSPIEVGAGELVNLAAEDQEGVAVEGDVAAGRVLPMTLQLSGGEVVELDVPVVPGCGEFEGLDTTTSGGGSTEQCEIVHEGEGH
jgi:hypothetical protein